MEFPADGSGISEKDARCVEETASIDALAVGVTLSFMETNIWLDIAIIGVLTFFIAGAGVFVGNIFGSKFKSKAEFAGGLILVILGVKILLEHTLGY